MKRGTIDHPKTARLADRLGIEHFAAVGLLECLFHFTAQYARRGDIGRHANKFIAQRCFWRDDPDAIVAALVECRWLDEHPSFRLIVHDWPQHADNTVRAALQRAGETFWNGDPPRRARHDEPGCEPVETPLERGFNGVAPFQAEPSQSQANREGHSLARGHVGGMIPTLEVVRAEAIAIGLSSGEAESFWHYYGARGWRTKEGQPIRSWPSALQCWKRTAGIRRVAGKANGPRIEARYDNPNDPLLGKGRKA